MNITELDYICKKRSREVFEAAKDSVLNHPFVDTPINQGIINDCIEFEIKQKLGAKIIKDFSVKNNLNNPIHLETINKKTAFYISMVTNTFTAFINKHIAKNIK
ncbi:hypothetical protein CXF68_20220 [Tenacibaculum sp. Bg11-29]|uniref:hypothetical protein n=1 Tax=Tenacibaculum sp. Bg11-29 TaxID=2058306 RepID=UPI000C3246D9|nr:hypothetical protein [Tenacibaculum sp. Bg11-29]PKH52881.1 hypothetical protein CXF68_20220 [Tenacibaculum sp. Bg11-29]